MTYYPAPNETSLAGLLRYDNVVTNDVFGLSLLVVIFAVMFMGMKSRNNLTGESLVASLFITLVADAFLFIMRVTTDYSVVVLIALLVVSGILLKRDS